MSKNVLIIGASILIVLGIVGGFFLKNRSSGDTAVEPTPTPELVELLTQDALSVSLKQGLNSQYILTVSKIPSDVTSISYEITYDTKNKGTQGIVGSPVPLKSGQATYTNDQIIFGTCSRNKCVFDEGVNNIQVNIRLAYKDGSEKGWKGILEL